MAKIVVAGVGVFDQINFQRGCPTVEALRVVRWRLVTVSGDYSALGAFNSLMAVAAFQITFSDTDIEVIRSSVAERRKIARPR